MSEATASPSIEPSAPEKDDWATTMSEQAAAETSPRTDTAQPAQIFEPLSGEGRKTSEPQGFDMIMDIPVALTVELGRTKIPIRNLLQLAHGSIVELDGMAGEPLDVLINGTLIAQGEVVVVNEKFGIRLTDIITPQERIRKLNR
jgi:flagellar motor switch protein FliN/FliY